MMRSKKLLGRVSCIIHLVYELQVGIGQRLTDVPLQECSRNVHQSGDEHQKGTEHEYEHEGPGCTEK